MLSDLTHQISECKFLVTLCTEGCSERVVARKMTGHLARDCRMRYVACTLKCGVFVRHHLLSTHVDNECLRRGRSDGKKEKKGLRID
jgi:hypothetical protein